MPELTMNGKINLRWDENFRISISVVTSFNYVTGLRIWTIIIFLSLITQINRQPAYELRNINPLDIQGWKIRESRRYLYCLPYP